MKPQTLAALRPRGVWSVMPPEMGEGRVPRELCTVASSEGDWAGDCRSGAGQARVEEPKFIPPKGICVP